MLQHKSGDRSRRMNIAYYMNPEYICGDRGSPKTSSRKLSIARMRIPDIAVGRENRHQKTKKHYFLVLFLQGRQTRKHCFLVMFSYGRQIGKHLRDVQIFAMFVILTPGPFTTTDTIVERIITTVNIAP